MNTFRSQFACLCLASLLLGGCASKVSHQSAQLDGKRLKLAEERLSNFLMQSCVDGIDSDVKLSWKAYAQQETYPATLQAAAPASLRLALTDPLGRPLLLLGSDGKTFTLADNRKAQGYRGNTELKFVRRFLPSFIPMDDLFLWLSGRVRGERMQTAAARTDAEGTLWWHGGSTDGRTAHILALDRQNRLSRHIVMDKKTDEILFEARYSGYVKTAKACAWPGKINLSGKALEADYSIEFGEIFGYGPLDKQRFEVTLPPHFTVKEMTDKD
jgi:outer membrane biogenesis lipoprotein LolB